MRLKDAAILIVDDDTDILTAVRLLLKYQVKEIVTEKNPDNILLLLKSKKIDLVLLDMNFKSAINTGNEGLFWLKNIKTKFPLTPVIMITAYAEVDLAVRSLKEGATDFVVKPWHNEKLLQTIKDALPDKNAERREKTDILEHMIIGRSAAMKDIFKKIEKVAPTDANILILGENGTGKDLVAKAIHQYSLRKNNLFVKVDVGALTETLFESELFGHKKGAFTDAHEDRQGKFAQANSGTIFLDEIGNIALPQQAKLLTVLQNRVVTPLGSNENIPIDIRLICATNIAVQKLADENIFRKDLIYRINTITICIPPLQERKEDIEPLTKHFCAIYAKKYFKPDIEISERAMKKLMDYTFPGNVRELQYTIERAVIMTDNPVIDVEDISFSTLENVVKETPVQTNETNLEELEKGVILKVIEKHKGNISRASKELGITRSALYRRLEKYEL